MWISHIPKINYLKMWCERWLRKQNKDTLKLESHVIQRPINFRRKNFRQVVILYDLTSGKWRGQNLFDKTFPHLKISPLTADKVFWLKGMKTGKVMPISNISRVFIILKGANCAGNQLSNAQTEYGATSSPAPSFFLIR